MRAVLGMVAALVLLSACSSSARHSSSRSSSSAAVKPSQAAVAAWFPKIEGDLRSIEADAAGVHSGLDPDRQDSCWSLQQEAGTFRAEPPSPDPEMRATLARMVAAYAKAGAQCQATGYDSAKAELAVGDNEDGVFRQLLVQAS